MYRVILHLLWIMSWWNSVTNNVKNYYSDTHSPSYQCHCKHAELRYQILQEIMKLNINPHFHSSVFTAVSFPSVFTSR